MEEKKDKRKTLILILVLLLLLIIGGSFAWFQIAKESEKINIIKAGSLSLTLDDIASEGIKLVNAVPMSYQQGLNTTEYTFTLTNNGSTSDYTIYLDNLDTYTNDNDENITITDDMRISDTKIRYILLIDGEEASATKSKLLSDITDRAIDTGTLESNGGVHTYSLRIWIDSKAGTEVNGKLFNAMLRVEATQHKNEIASKTICKRATTLHTEECSQTDSTYYCSGAGYTESGSKKTIIITYGSTGTTGTLTSGDAFDCDVNGDGTYDEETERFYYVADMDEDTAVLIYYNNVSVGVASNSTRYAYDSSNVNNNGPVTAMLQLPTTEQWKNVSLTNTSRAIINESGGTTTTAGDLPTAFSYEGYVARLLTAQEVNFACGITVGSYATGELDNCNYLMENTKYSNSSLASYGYWLETPRAFNSYPVWGVYGLTRSVRSDNASNSSNDGVRPVIEVVKSNISY